MDEVERLIEELANADKEARVYAAKRLGELNDVRAVDALVGAMKHEDWKLQIEVRNALEAIGVPAVRSLINALRGTDCSMQKTAAHVLGNIAESNPEIYCDAAPALTELLNNPDCGVRESAVGAFTLIPEASAREAKVVAAVPALLLLLEDENPGVRTYVTAALKAIAKANPDVVGVVAPPLVEALKDGDRNMQRWAAAALEEITDGQNRIETLFFLEKKIREGIAPRFGDGRERRDIKGMMEFVVKLMRKVTDKKNELARKEMEADGLMLAGERPKPPKNGGMYQVARKQAARCG